MLLPPSVDDNVVTCHSAEHPCGASALRGLLAGVGHLHLGDILKEDEITLLRSADANLEVPKWSDDVIHHALRHNHSIPHPMRVNNPDSVTVGLCGISIFECSLHLDLPSQFRLSCGGLGESDFIGGARQEDAPFLAAKGSGEADGFDLGAVGSNAPGKCEEVPPIGEVWDAVVDLSRPPFSKHMKAVEDRDHSLGRIPIPGSCICGEYPMRKDTAKLAARGTLR